MALTSKDGVRLSEIGRSGKFERRGVLREKVLANSREPRPLTRTRKVTASIHEIDCFTAARGNPKRSEHLEAQTIRTPCSDRYSFIFCGSLKRVMNKAQLIQAVVLLAKKI